MHIEPFDIVDIDIGVYHYSLLLECHTPTTRFFGGRY